MNTVLVKCVPPEKNPEAGVAFFLDPTKLADGMTKHPHFVGFGNPAELAHTLMEDRVIPRALL